MSSRFKSIAMVAALLFAAPGFAAELPVADETIVVTGARATPAPVELPHAIADGRVEARRYVSPADARHAVRSALATKGSKLIEDDSFASGHEIGRPYQLIRRIRVQGPQGASTLLVSQDAPRAPFGDERASVAVPDIAKALRAVEADGGAILAGPFAAGSREVALIRAAEGGLFELHGPRRPVSRSSFGASHAYRAIDTDRKPLPLHSTVGQMASISH
jgi:hypothetical protein